MSILWRISAINDALLSFMFIYLLTLINRTLSVSSFCRWCSGESSRYYLRRAHYRSWCICWTFTAKGRSFADRGTLSLRWAYRYLFDGIDTLILGNFLHCKFLIKSRDYVWSSFYLLDFLLGVLLNEIINVHIATAYSYFNLIAFFDFDIDTLWAKLINTCGLSQEKDFHPFLLRVLIEVACQCHVNPIVLVTDVDRLLLGQILEIIHEFSNLRLRSLQ